MKEYDIKGISAEELIVIVSSLSVVNHASNDDDVLDLINEVLRKIKKAVEAV